MGCQHCRFFWQDSSGSKRSATNFIYVDIKSQFLPMSLTGKASVRNSISISTASETISTILDSDGLFFRWWNMRQAKSVCRPSSREINSFENVNPGINPLFLSQKIAANDPEKKMPSTDANAIILSEYDALLIQFNAQLAFFITAGTVSIALNNFSFSAGSLMYVSIKSEYISL